MARPRKAIPDYRFHLSGQAVVTLAGQDFYLGKHDSPESRAKYLELLRIYQENGLRMPDQIASHQNESPVSVACVTAEFREYAQIRYDDNPGRLRRFLNLCSLLEDEYGDCPIDEFGPRKLSALRDQFVDRGNGRVYVNERVREIVQVIRFGVSRELVEANVIVRLKSLEPLRAGTERTLKQLIW